MDARVNGVPAGHVRVVPRPGHDGNAQFRWIRPSRRFSLRQSTAKFRGGDFLAAGAA